MTSVLPRLPRENAYLCPKCHQFTTTVDVDDGVTPMFLKCRATPGCTGTAASNFYPRHPRPAHIPPPAWEWFKPTAEEIALLDPLMQDHVARGGLDIRARTDREPRYHDDAPPPTTPTSRKVVMNRAQRRARLRRAGKLPSQRRRR